MPARTSKSTEKAFPFDPASTGVLNPSDTLKLLALPDTDLPLPPKDLGLENLHRATFVQLPLGVGYAPREGQFIWCNEAFELMLGLAPESELAPSALAEIGNVVGTSYLNALAGMTGLALDPTPPATVTDFLGAIVETVLTVRAASSDHTLLLDSSLVIEGEDCSIVFLLVPDHGGAGELLERVGLA